MLIGLCVLYFIKEVTSIIMFVIMIIVVNHGGGGSDGDDGHGCDGNGLTTILRNSDLIIGIF